MVRFHGLEICGATLTQAAMLTSPVQFREGSGPLELTLRAGADADGVLCGWLVGGACG